VKEKETHNIREEEMKTGSKQKLEERQREYKNKLHKLISPPSLRFPGLGSVAYRSQYCCTEVALIGVLFPFCLLVGTSY